MMPQTATSGRRATQARPVPDGGPAAPAAQLTPARLPRIWVFRCTSCLAAVDFDGRHLDSGLLGDCGWPS